MVRLGQSLHVVGQSLHVVGGSLYLVGGSLYVVGGSRRGDPSRRVRRQMAGSGPGHDGDRACHTGNVAMLPARWPDHPLRVGTKLPRGQDEEKASASWRKMTAGSRNVRAVGMNAERQTHVVLIPSYNTGARLFETIAGVRQRGLPVVVVIDGSTDGTADAVTRMAADDPALFVRVLPVNQGKGAAVSHGLELALSKGFTHALTMDADGQHSAAHIETMIAESLAHPEAMVLGVPVFDDSAPRIRVLGHGIANFWTALVTAGGGIGDFAVRISCVSDRAAAPHLRGDVGHAALRFRFRGGDPAMLAWRPSDQHSDAGAIFPPGRRRRFALQVPAR